MTRIIVTGSVAYDFIMAIPGKFSDYIMPDKIHMLNISFDVDKLTRSYGGNGANLAYGLAKMGNRPQLLATVGEDFNDYENWLTKSGVDLSLVKKVKGLCASGFVVTDKKDNQIWSFFRGVMGDVKKVNFKSILKKDDLFVFGPLDMDTSSVMLQKIKPIKPRMIFDPSFHIPNIKPEELKLGIKLAEVIFGNDYEIELLLRRTKSQKSEWLKMGKILVTTLADKGSLIETKDNTIKVGVAKPKKLVDPTGAGDAYRAGFLSGYVKGLDLGTCGRLGAVNASYAIEQLGTQTYQFSLTEFNKRYKSNFGK